MLIRLKKVEAGVVLSCSRDGGSAAVQRTGHAGFFALHDLMHYAVETTLGFRRAFFGLMSEGWSFDTFADRNDPRYRSIPAEAIRAEHLVAILSRVCSEAAWMDPELLPTVTEDINREIAAVLPGDGLMLSPEQVSAIALSFSELASRWKEVPIGEHLELRFPPE